MIGRISVVLLSVRLVGSAELASIINI